MRRRPRLVADEVQHGRVPRYLETGPAEVRPALIPAIAATAHLDWGLLQWRRMQGCCAHRLRAGAWRHRHYCWRSARRGGGVDRLVRRFLRVAELFQRENDACQFPVMRPTRYMRSREYVCH